MSAHPPIVARRIVLAERPQGSPSADTWALDDTPLRELGDGEVVVRVSYVSIDPAMRGWINDVRSYMPPVGLGETMRAFGTAEVLQSRHPRFAPGDKVTGMVGVTDHSILRGEELQHIDLAVAPAPTWLGALGLTGMTAWFGLFDVARPRPGDVVLVSGAAGAVGSIVGQLAKAHGCHVIGVAGGPEKTRWLTDELGFDAAIDYREGHLRRAIRTLAPTGIDVYFDNVGGELLDVALRSLRKGARIAICGAISTYNAVDPPPGPASYMALLVHSASMTGFLAYDFEERFPEAVEGISRRRNDGSIVVREHIVTGGVDAFHEAFTLLFNGGNTGKLVLEL